MLSGYNVKLQQNVSVQNTDANYSIASHFLSDLSSLFLLGSDRSNLTTGQHADNKATQYCIYFANQVQ